MARIISHELARKSIARIQEIIQDGPRECNDGDGHVDVFFDDEGEYEFKLLEYYTKENELRGLFSCGDVFEQRKAAAGLLEMSEPGGEVLQFLARRGH